MPASRSSCFLFLIIANITLANFTASDEYNDANSYPLLLNTLDWVSKSDMSDQQKATINRHSCGAFIDPLTNNQGELLEMEDAPLLVYSEDSEASVDSSVTLKGDVQISQGNRKIRANTATLDQGNR